MPPTPPNPCDALFGRIDDVDDEPPVPPPDEPLAVPMLEDGDMDEFDDDDDDEDDDGAGDAPLCCMAVGIVLLALDDGDRDWPPPLGALFSDDRLLLEFDGCCTVDMGVFGPMPVDTGDVVCDPNSPTLDNENSTEDNVVDGGVGVAGDAVVDGVAAFTGDKDSDAFVGDALEELCVDGNNDLSRFSFSILLVYLT